MRLNRIDKRRKRNPDVASLVKRQIDVRIGTLEKKLFEELILRERQLIRKSVAAVSEKLDTRIQSLERNAVAQLRQLSDLEEWSHARACQLDLAMQSVGESVGRISLLITATAPVPARVVASPDIQAAPTKAAVVKSRFACPKCLSTDLCRNRQPGFLDGFLRLVCFMQFRCRNCRSRF